MTGLRIEVRKLANGDSVLKCERADGSLTWQRNEGPRARFFPLHDLTHYAVETLLATEDGFYGLIARGWDIPDTTGKGTRGALPDATTAIEHLVGILDAERTSGAAATAAEVNTYITAFAQQQERAPLPALTDDVLGRIRSETARLQARWRALDAGDTLTLSFCLSPPGQPETSGGVR